MTNQQDPSREGEEPVRALDPAATAAARNAATKERLYARLREQGVRRLDEKRQRVRDKTNARNRKLRAAQKAAAGNLPAPETPS